MVRSALRAKDGVAPAIDFLDKAEGKKGILRAVAEAFDNHIHVNWELEIEPTISFLHLADLIEPGLDQAFLPGRAQELEDLFRRLFFRNGRCGLTAYFGRAMVAWRCESMRLRIRGRNPRRWSFADNRRASLKTLATHLDSEPTQRACTELICKIRLRRQPVRQSLHSDRR